MNCSKEKELVADIRLSATIDAAGEGRVECKINGRRKELEIAMGRIIKTMMDREEGADLLMNALDKI